MSGAGRWKLTNVKRMLDDGDGPVADELAKIVAIIEEEGNQNFILGKVIIENDSEEDEEDE